MNAWPAAMSVALLLAASPASGAEDLVRLAARSRNLDRAKIYPYLVPPEYPDTLSTPRQPRRVLGHGVAVALVVDHDGVVEGVSADGLARAQLGLDAAYALAAENLARLLRSQEIKLQLFESGPEGQPFVLVGGHWGAATAILDPGLRALAAEALKTKDLCASVPHREAMLIFPKGTRRARDAMRALIRQNESDGAKPLTFELFELTADGPTPFHEGGAK